MTHAGGRPSDYNDKIADEICSAIATNPCGLATLIKQNPHWPHRCTIFEWRLKHSQFADKYAKAKQDQIETFVDNIFESVDDKSQDFYETKDGQAINSAAMARLRIKVDAIKWLASKLAPKLYGERKETTHGVSGEGSLMEKLINKL